jgi:hypothetical protein
MVDFEAHGDSREFLAVLDLLILSRVLGARKPIFQCS